MRPLRMTVLLLVALAPLTACGDDDDGGGAALTKAELIERGDAICREASEEGSDLDEPEQDDPEDLSRFLGEAIDIVTEAADEFEQLDPPADGESVHELEVEALRGSVEVLERAKVEADAGDYEAAREIVAGADPEAAARGPLQAYGFEVCGAE